MIIYGIDDWAEQAAVAFVCVCVSLYLLRSSASMGQDTIDRCWHRYATVLEQSS